jgi:hypothetical protein
MRLAWRSGARSPLIAAFVEVVKQADTGTLDGSIRVRD